MLVGRGALVHNPKNSSYGPENAVFILKQLAYLQPLTPNKSGRGVVFRPNPVILQVANPVYSGM